MLVDAPSGKHEQEDAVVRSLLDFLRRSGLHAVLLDQPDRTHPKERVFPTLTSDALVEIGKNDSKGLWSIDVMADAAAPDFGPTLQAISTRLAKLGKQFDVTFRVEGTIPQPKKVATILKKIKKVLKRNGRRSIGMTIDGLDISWTSPFQPEMPVELALDQSAASTLLSDQLAETLYEPLRHKATRQAKPAKQLGLHAAVVIDRVGHKEILQGTHFLPRRAETYRAAVETCIADVPHHLDAVLLHDSARTFHLLQGNFPAFD